MKNIIRLNLDYTNRVSKKNEGIFKFSFTPKLFFIKKANITDFKF